MTPAAIKRLSADMVPHVDRYANEWLPGGTMQGREYVVLCPFHNERTPSFNINLATGQWLCRGCEAKGHDLVSLYAKLNNLKNGEAAERLSGGNGSSTPSAQRQPAGTPRPAPRDDWHPVIGDEPNVEIKKHHFKHGTPIAVWPYYNADGQFVGWTCRFAPPGPKALPFCRCRYVGTTTDRYEQGREYWIWHSFATPRPLYGLPAALCARRLPVWIVEGEKTADAAQRLLGSTAMVVTWPGGCQAVMHADFSPLIGRSVTIWPDADAPGIGAAHRIKSILPDAEVLHPPEGVAPGWDLADAEADRWDLEQITAHVAWSRAVEPIAEPDAGSASECPATPEPGPNGVTVPPNPRFQAFYDSGKRHFWVQTASGLWIGVNDSAVKLHLQAQGFARKSDDAVGGAPCPQSPCDREFVRIQREQSVAYAGPLAGYSVGALEMSGHLILVTSSPKLIEPAPGEWPTLRALFAGLFQDDSEQIHFFFGWLQSAIVALRSQSKRPGQALAIAGPAGCGKSLLQNLITRLLGGRAAKPYRYMSGATPFNGDLFGAEHLMIEDEVASKDMRSRRHFGQTIKGFCVNSVQSCHAKHQNAVHVEPFWRVTISVNDEPEALLVLPPMDESIRDKIMLLKASAPQEPFPTGSVAHWRQYQNQLTSELPAFIHFLLSHFTVPANLVSERYGIREFHHPEILNALLSLSDEFRLLGIIDSELFTAPIPSPWQGTASQLEKHLLSGTYYHETRKLLSWNNACGTLLGRLEDQFPDRVQSARTASTRNWLIAPLK